MDIGEQLLRLKELSVQLNVMTDRACKAINRVETFFTECNLTMKIEAEGIHYHNGHIYATDTDGSLIHWPNCKRDVRLQLAIRLPALLAEASALSERTLTAAADAEAIVDKILTDADRRPIRLREGKRG